MSCSAKTTGENAHYPLCAACRPARRAAMGGERMNWRDPVELSALPPSEAATAFVRRWSPPLHLTGALAAKAVTQGSGGAAVAQGEPAGASDGVGRRDGGWRNLFRWKRHQRFQHIGYRLFDTEKISQFDPGRLWTAKGPGITGAGLSRHSENDGDDGT